MNRAPRLLRRLIRSERGLGAVEFALVAPVLLLLIFGMLQLGMLFIASNGLTHAVAEGARYATIFPRPTDEELIAHIEGARFGMKESRVTEPKIEWQQVEGSGAHFVDIEMRYAMPLNFVFFETPPITLRETRRAYVQPPRPES
ncbi:MAG: TadE/TadG family type IV pilus assembly protein [Allosphingosinicella sp.]|uniref:TadE/TadG family type IV pilus assembly protein n=1 Tax=Allosphingosinicella sp. TaxID=2823234 RepID=UPI00396018B2